MSGIVESIHIAPGAGETTVLVEKVMALAGIGLEGDRIALKAQRAAAAAATAESDAKRTTGAAAEADAKRTTAAAEADAKRTAAAEADAKRTAGAAEADAKRTAAAAAATTSATAATAPDEDAVREGSLVAPKRQVTLIEAEALEALARDYSIPLSPGESRRNICTRGVALNHLVGRTFRVGGALLRGIKLCEPCEYMEKLSGRPGARKGLVHRGGLRAEIVHGGLIRRGDPIEVAE